MSALCGECLSRKLRCLCLLMRSGPSRKAMCSSAASAYASKSVLPVIRSTARFLAFGGALERRLLVLSEVHRERGYSVDRRVRVVLLWHL